MDVRREEGFVHDRVRHVKLPEQVVRLRDEPGLVAKLDRPLVAVGEGLEERADDFGVEAKRGGQLEQERAELPRVVQRVHQLAERADIFLGVLGDVNPPVVGDGLRDLCGEHEVVWGVPEPAEDHPLRRRPIETRVDLSRVEHLRIRGELALARGLVEDPQPLLVRPA